MEEARNVEQEKIRVGGSGGDEEVRRGEEMGERGFWGLG